MALCKIQVGEGGAETWGWIGNRPVHYHRVHLIESEAVKRCFAGQAGTTLSSLQGQVGEASAEPLEIHELAEAAEREYPRLAPPLGDGMEVWAAGVTYESSKFARMAESPEGGDFYARVYVAERPDRKST